MPFDDRRTAAGRRRSSGRGAAPTSPTVVARGDRPRRSAPRTNIAACSMSRMTRARDRLYRLRHHGKRAPDAGHAGTRSSAAPCSARPRAVELDASRMTGEPVHGVRTTQAPAVAPGEGQAGRARRRPARRCRAFGRPPAADAARPLRRRRRRPHSRVRPRADAPAVASARRPRERASPPSAASSSTACSQSLPDLAAGHGARSAERFLAPCRPAT